MARRRHFLLHLLQMLVDWHLINTRHVVLLGVGRLVRVEIGEFETKLLQRMECLSVATSLFFSVVDRIFFNDRKTLSQFGHNAFIQS